MSKSVLPTNERSGKMKKVRSDARAWNEEFAHAFLNRVLSLKELSR